MTNTIEVSPSVFSRKKLTSIFQNDGVKAFLNPQFACKEGVRSLLQIVNLCRSPKILELARSGQVTLASIKPRLDLDIKKPSYFKTDNDEEIAELIIKEDIETDFKILGRFDLVFDHHSLMKFYNSKNQLKKLPIDSNRYGTAHQTRWHEFEYLMTHWPTTFLLLYSENDAINKWREKIGSTYKLKKLLRKERDTLRAKYELTEHNSIFHGSSSLEDLFRELEILAEFAYGTALEITRNPNSERLGEYFQTLNSQLNQ